MFQRVRLRGAGPAAAVTQVPGGTPGPSCSHARVQGAAQVRPVGRGGLGSSGVWQEKRRRVWLACTAVGAVRTARDGTKQSNAVCGRHRESRGLGLRGGAVPRGTRRRVSKAGDCHVVAAPTSHASRCPRHGAGGGRPQERKRGSARTCEAKGGTGGARGGPALVTPTRPRRVARAAPNTETARPPESRGHGRWLQSVRRSSSQRTQNAFFCFCFFFKF